MRSSFARWTVATSLATAGLAGGVWLADRSLERSEPTVPAAVTTGREVIRVAVESGDCAELRRTVVRWRDALDGTGPGTSDHDIPALLMVEARDAHRELGCRSSVVDPPTIGSPGVGSTRVAFR